MTQPRVGDFEVAAGDWVRYRTDLTLAVKYCNAFIVAL